MSTAAGIGALAEGFTRGLQLSSDLQDREQRRGLAGLQMKREQAALQKDEAITSVRQQIADRVMNFNPTDPNNQEEFDQYYNALTPLMMKEATLAGANPELVRQSMSNLRGARYAENLYQGISKIQAGDASGFDIIKPLYNKMFKDGGTLVGGAYDRESDKILLNYRDANGNDQSMSVPRQAFVKQALGYANPADAMKLEYAALQENARTLRDQGFQLNVLGRTQDFTAGQNTADRNFRASESGLDRNFRASESGLDRDLRRGLQTEDIAARRAISEGDNQAALTRTRISAGATVAAAREGRDARQDRYDDQVYQRNRDQFVSGLATAFDYDPKSMFKDEKKTAEFNANSSRALTIWEATQRGIGANLSPEQVAFITNPANRKNAKILNGPDGKPLVKDGYAVIQLGAIKAVVPTN